MPQANRRTQSIWLVAIFPVMLFFFGSSHGKSAPHFFTLFQDNPAGNVVGIVVLGVLTAIFARICERFPEWRVSPLVGEMFAGFLLGTSILGAIVPSLFESVPHLSRIAHDIGWIGVLLMVQESGFGIDPAQVRRSGLGVAVLGVVCVIVPFGGALFLGAFTTLIAHELQGQGSWGLYFFALFISISGLVSALRVLREFRPLQADIRRTVIPAYALNELLGFVPLAILLAFTTPDSDSVWTSFRNLGIAGIFAALSVFISPRTRRWFEQHQKSFAISNALRPALGIIFGMITDRLGLTPLLGFFIAGTVSGTAFERDNARSPEMRYSPYRFSMGFLVPIYFASIGIGLNIWENLNLGLTIFVTISAIGLRYGGAVLGARLPPNQFGIGEQRLFGWLFTPAGVTGVIVAQVGRSLDLFSEPLFTAMVISVPVSVALLPWPLGRVIKELEDAQPVSSRTLAPYLLRAGVLRFTAPGKLAPNEDDMSFMRRLIPVLCQVFKKHLRHKVDLDQVAKEMVGDGKTPPAIVPFGYGVVLAHYRVRKLAEPIVMLARLTHHLDIQTPDNIEPQLIIFTLAVEGDDGAQRVGQQFWIQKQISAAFYNHPERVRSLLAAQSPNDLYEVAQEIFRGQA